MPKYVFVNPANPKQQVLTLDKSQAPAGYVQSNTSDGSAQIVDGATDQDLQQFVGGLWSGGFPQYNGYKDGSATNGILGGGKV